MQGRQVKTTYSKKRVVDGISRIPKTFVFDQNLPKEEYLKYINPENIIPESIEIATQVFSNYRKKTGSANMNRLNKVDQLTSASRNKQMQPLMEIDKAGVNKDFTTLRNETLAFENNVTKNMDEIKQNLKKIMDKSKLNEMIQESTLDLKVNLKDMTTFSMMHDTKNNIDYVNENPQLSPTKGGNGIRSNEDSFNQSRLVLQPMNSAAKPKTAPANEIFVIEQSSPKAAMTGNGKMITELKSPKNEMKKTFQKKKEVTEDDYKISELDNTVEIVKKTDLAVRALAKRSELVKRDMRNFEEIVKTKMKENESAPISSIRAMNLVRDFVFNDDEFKKLFN